MTTYREASENAKNAKRGITEQRPAGTRSQRDRPFTLEHRINPESRLSPLFGMSWRRWGAYRTEAEAIQTMERLQRKYSFYEFRLHRTGIKETK